MIDALKSLSIMGYYGNQNCGDEAILTALLAGLKKKLPEAEYVVLSSDPEFTKTEYGVNSVADILPPNRRRHLICSLGRNRRSFIKAVRVATASDVLIVGGGGLLFDRPEGNKHLLEFLGKIAFARRKGMRIVFLGVGVGPLYHLSSKRAVVKLLSQAELIVLREAASKELLLSAGLEHSHIHVAGDLGFLLEPTDSGGVKDIMNRLKLSSDRRPVVAICLRGTDAMKPSVTEAVAGLVRYLQTNHSARIWFLPFQFFGGDDDRPGLASLKKLFSDQDSVDFIDQPLGVKELNGLISQADLLVGQRFHSLVFAASHSKPFIGISYHPKVSRLFQQLEREDLSVELNEIEPDSLISRFDLMWAERESIVSQVKQLYDSQRSQAENNFELFFSHFGISR